MSANGTVVFRQLEIDSPRAGLGDAQVSHDRLWYVREDPFRIGAHFPAVTAEIGDLDNKRILDMGTGDGQLPRLLATNGAAAVGYDHNPRMIRQALAHADNRHLDVKFVEATPRGFHDDDP